MTVTAGQWQLQEAKQHFSELIRAVRTDGPQFVTKHGQQVAVVLDIVDYRRMTGADVVDFKSFLGSVPDLSELDLERSTAPARTVEFE
ncbi:type II toxin-antitoxin system Phd/YefM family antitoxin [Kribbella solani]|uniref:Antitoxin n=1 Tax=Kribbella solani TaxID=236067 RepID=A0A841DLV2_9ACTN|nr:type II toxin-antitoxin system Phd/YefM family antitoxin [Kribbella solani]MBB5977640.1 prevent-host-death family protein [Kribbella solani]MDX2970258.1 type II toxin-antitoxin system Phd/YefM family antitoxin [Kribbella solani]MDX3001951.1 type II toxin-antitoxin system Phd/YefM family antitoxin [Kribbella solani]